MLTNKENGGIMVAGSGKMNVLPKIENVVIPVEKFTEYILNPEKDPDKSITFKKALGYTLANYHNLIENIKANMYKFPAKAKGNKGHGELYEVIMEIKGENGKTARVLTAWMDDRSKNELRLITAHVD